MHHSCLRSWRKIALTVLVLCLLVSILRMMSSDATYQWSEVFRSKQAVVHSPQSYLNPPNDNQGPSPAESRSSGRTASSPSFVAQVNSAEQQHNPEQIISNEGELQDREKINSKRVKEMNEYCKKLDQEGSLEGNPDIQKIVRHQLDRLFVNDKYKLIHCSIPKIACTNWKKLFLGLAGVKSPFSEISGSDVHKPGTPAFKQLFQMRLSNYSPKEIAYILQHYTKAIVVREPMERALSAYRNKLGDNPGREQFQETYGARILRQYRPDLPQDVRRKGVGVTFQEFVRYLTHPTDFAADVDYLDEHWEQYISLCNPCSVRYNVIAKYETLGEDMRIILKKINASDAVTWPEYHGEEKGHVTTGLDLVLEAVRNIPSDDIQAFLALFYKDYKMFGYKFQRYGKENVSLPIN